MSTFIIFENAQIKTEKSAKNVNGDLKSKSKKLKLLL